jgi:hypothetical protein
MYIFLYLNGWPSSFIAINCKRAPLITLCTKLWSALFQILLLLLETELLKACRKLNKSEKALKKGLFLFPFSSVELELHKDNSYYSDCFTENLTTRDLCFASIEFMYAISKNKLKSLALIFM